MTDIRRRRFGLGVLVLGISVAATGCASASTAPHAITQEHIQLAAATTSTTTINVAAFASNLSAAVAQQNLTGFGARGYTKGVATGHTSSTDSDASTDATTTPAVTQGTAFSSKLTPAASTDYSAQTVVISDAKTALQGESITVTRVDVSVDAVSATVPATQPGTTIVTSDLYISRTMNNGIVWEEVVPYISTVTDATGAITDLEVHDDSWNDEAEEIDVPVDETGIPSDVLNGIEPTPTTTPAPTSTPTSKPTPRPTLTTGPIDPTVVVGSGTGQANASASSASFTTTQRSNAVAYADKYWKNYNTNYVRSPNDCTNFISQALYAGGWKKVTGYYTSDDAWWYTGNILIPKSKTWASAQQWSNFALRSGRTTNLPYFQSARTADIVQYDIGAKGMNHTMIVTKDTGSEKYLTYHTSEVHNKPFSVVRAIVAKEDSSPDWYIYRT